MKNVFIAVLIILLLVSLYFNYTGRISPKEPRAPNQDTKPFAIDLGKDSIEVYFYDASLGDSALSQSNPQAYGSMTAPTGLCDNSQLNQMVCGKISVPGGIVVNPKDLFQNTVPGFHEIGIRMRVLRSNYNTHQEQIK